MPLLSQAVLTFIDTDLDALLKFYNTKSGHMGVLRQWNKDHGQHKFSFGKQKNAQCNVIINNSGR